ncbi:MAG: MmgE/PrpD family protein [Solirubrobacteraceae bacterium]
MAVTASAGDIALRDTYAAAFTDWLACACAGVNERAATAVQAGSEGVVGEIAWAATAGHVHDYDDTFSDGVAHVSATTAPAALGLAAHLGTTVGEALAAYAEGYEAMAAVAAASHPALYDAGWHPTAVCGPIGAVVAASRLLGLTGSERESALAIALLRAGGTRGAFGSDGKAVQVGLAAAAGAQAALLARAGARVRAEAIHGPLGFTAVLGASWAELAEREKSVGKAEPEPAITRNWIKLHPSCLGTHAPIDAAAQLRDAGVDASAERVEVRVHPVARQAAHLDAVNDGLEAKFSIPYCVMHTLLHGPPRLRDFAEIDADARERSARVTVSVDASLPEFGAVVALGGREPVWVECPRGAPGRPLQPAELHAKVKELAGDRLEGLLDDPSRPAAEVVAALSTFRR